MQFVDAYCPLLIQLPHRGIWFNELDSKDHSNRRIYSIFIATNKGGWLDNSCFVNKDILRCVHQHLYHDNRIPHFLNWGLSYHRNHGDSRVTIAINGFTDITSETERLALVTMESKGKAQATEATFTTYCEAKQRVTRVTMTVKTVFNWFPLYLKIWSRWLIIKLFQRLLSYKIRP